MKLRSVGYKDFDNQHALTSRHYNQVEARPSTRNEMGSGNSTN